MQIAIILMVCLAIGIVLTAFEDTIKKLRLAMLLKRMGRIADKMQRLVSELGLDEVEVYDENGTSETENIEEENSKS